MSIRKLSTIVLAISVVFAGSALADDADKERQEIGKMREEVLAKLYKEKPETKAAIASSKGYAVFSNIGINVLLLSTARGAGVVRDSRNSKDTYMKMLSLGGGIGLGIKDFSVVFVFNEAGALDKFLESGWDFSA